MASRLDTEFPTRCRFSAACSGQSCPDSVVYCEKAVQTPMMIDCGHDGDDDGDDDICVSFRKTTHFVWPMREVMKSATLNEHNANKMTSDPSIVIATARLAEGKCGKRCILLQHKTHPIGGLRIAGCQPRAACTTCLEFLCQLDRIARRCAEGLSPLDRDAVGQIRHHEKHLGTSFAGFELFVPLRSLVGSLLPRSLRFRSNL